MADAPDPVVRGDPLARHSSSARDLKRLLEVQRSGSPFLAYRDADGELKLLTLGPERPSISIGRRSGLDVTVGWDAEVSGVHAELQRVAGEWVIVDDGLSKNGTFVNGTRVAGRQRLRDADRIRVGQTLIVVTAAGEAVVGLTRTAGDIPAVEQLSNGQRRVLAALCRPLADGSNAATPATNKQIAAELFLSVPAVKATLRTLFDKFELDSLPQNQKRAKLAHSALQFGLVGPNDL